jgi:hypothetical protein
MGGLERDGVRTDHRERLKMATKPKIPKASPQIALAVSMAAFALVHFFPETTQHRIYLALGVIVAGIFCLGFVLARFRRRKD